MQGLHYLGDADSVSTQNSVNLSNVPPFALCDNELIIVTDTLYTRDVGVIHNDNVIHVSIDPCVRRKRTVGNVPQNMEQINVYVTCSGSGMLLPATSQFTCIQRRHSGR
jgi:hypothetical protein